MDQTCPYLYSFGNPPTRERTYFPVLAFNATCYLSRTFSSVGFRAYYTKAYSFGNPPTHRAWPARKQAHEESPGHGPAGEQLCEDRQPWCSCTGRGCRDHSARVPFPPGRAPPPPLLALVVPKRRNIEQRKEGPKGMDNTLMSYEPIRQ